MHGLHLALPLSQRGNASFAALKCYCWLQGVVRVHSPAFGGSWVPVFDAQAQCSASVSCWPVGLDQQSLYCIIGPAAQSAPPVCPLRLCDPDGKS